jgi:hypothetical protein
MMATTYMEGKIIVHDGVVLREDVADVAAPVELDPIAPPVAPVKDEAPAVKVEVPVEPKPKAKGKKR